MKTNLILLLLSCIIALTISEIAIRFVAKDIVPMGVPSYELGYTARPNLKTVRFDPESERMLDVSINEYGYKDEGWDFNNNSYKIMVIGDSFVDAYQVPVEKRFDKLLGGHLTDDGYPVTTYNFGRSGSGPESYLLALRKFYPIIKPDLVVVSFFNGNDYENVNAKLSPRSGRVAYIVEDKEVIPYINSASLKEKLTWHSRVILGQLYSTQILKKVADSQRVKRIMQNPTTSTAVREPFYCKVDNQDLLESQMIVTDILTEMNKITGGKMVVLQIPTKEQVYGDLKESITCDPELPEKMLLGSAVTHSIQLVQLLEDMQLGEGDYYWSHFNENGHEFAAQQLYRYVTPLLEHSDDK